MPSGAKKRKAAKKKKEREAQQQGIGSNNGDGNPHGNEDARSQDGKESDGDVSSPGSQDHENNRNFIIEGTEESGKEGPSAVRSSVADEESVKEVNRDVEGTSKLGLDIEGSITIERELKSEGNKVKKPTDSLQLNVIHTTENVPLQEAGVSLTMETAPVVDSVKHVILESERVICVENTPDGSSLVFDGDKPKSNENEEKLLPKLDKDRDVSLDVVDELSKGLESNKESNINGCSDKEPLVASASPVVRRTSWLSCCGLLDVVTGSSG